MASYEVEIIPEGLRHLNRLPEKVRAAVLETIFGSIADNPRRAGKPLRGELEGLYSARRGEFRVIYEIDEDAGTILVHRAQHRGQANRRR
ncbi:MAG: type II toxin-antitoxin system RelE family toxin [Actinomycetota bacterium]